MRLLLALAGALCLALLAGCGGGGGGGSSGGGGPETVSLFGRIIWAGTGGAPSPQATVRSGDASTLTSPVDGGFAFDVPRGTTSLTVSATVGGTPIVRSFTFPSATAATDLGDLYIGSEEVTVTGRVLDAQTSAPLAGASVSIAGRTGVSGADGRFSIPQVAYSSSGLAVFLGLQGTASRTGYFQGSFSPPAAPAGATANVGDVSLTPTGGDDPPPLPTNLKVTVSPSGEGAVVEVLSGGATIRSGTAGPGGVIQFWLPAGAYTVRATKAGQNGTAPANVASPSTLVSINVALT